MSDGSSRKGREVQGITKGGKMWSELGSLGLSVSANCAFFCSLVVRSGRMASGAKRCQKRGKDAGTRAMKDSEEGGSRRRLQRDDEKCPGVGCSTLLPAWATGVPGRVWGTQAGAAQRRSLPLAGQNPSNCGAAQLQSTLLIASVGCKVPRTHVSAAYSMQFVRGEPDPSSFFCFRIMLPIISLKGAWGGTRTDSLVREHHDALGAKSAWLLKADRFRALKCNDGATLQQEPRGA
jgi:hypothetical protein